MKRRWEIDALRGLMLVLMNFTHLPTRFAGPTGQPFGFVSAAEGFVLLAGFVAGMVYSERARRDGFASMRRSFLVRAAKLYGCQAALLLFLFTIIALLGIRIDQPAVKNLMTFYLQHHATGLWSGLLLIYNPPLLDILPMYIALMLVSPWLLTHGLERGWRGILVASAVLWLLAQFNVGHLLYDALVALTGLPVPFHETGSFSVLAWQLLWVMGLWLGSGSGAAVRPPVPKRFPRWVLLPVIGFASACLVWRHVVGQTPFPDSPGLNALFDKWPLAPLRLLDLLTMMVLAIQFGPWLAARLPRPRFLVLLGSASLPVYCAHLVIVLLALALVGDLETPRPLWLDVLVTAISFSLLGLVAWVTRWLDRRPKARVARNPSPASSTGAMPAASPADACGADPAIAVPAPAATAARAREPAIAFVRRPQGPVVALAQGAGACSSAARVSGRGPRRSSATTRSPRRSGAAGRRGRARREVGPWRRASA